MYHIECHERIETPFTVCSNSNFLPIQVTCLCFRMASIEKMPFSSVPLFILFVFFFMFNLRLCTARPLDIPLKDRMVSNVTFEGPMTAQQDYRFTVTVTWKPPVYPHITPSMYLVRWSKEDSFDRSHSAVREITSY